MNNTNFWIKTLIFGLRSTLFDPKMSIWNQKYAITSRNQYYSQRYIREGLDRARFQWPLFHYWISLCVGFSLRRRACCLKFLNSSREISKWRSKAIIINCTLLDSNCFFLLLLNTLKVWRISCIKSLNNDWLI